MNALSTYKKSADLVEQVVDGELVVLDQDSGQIHQFNATASEIWMCIDGKTATDEIISRIAEHFSIELEVAKKDVESTLQQLHEQNLIET